MTNPAPLSVDPEQLGFAGKQLLTSAAQLPTAPAPFLPAGSDPLSVAIIGQIPTVDGRPMTELPLMQAQSTTTARNIVGAAAAYASTDQQLGGQIGKEMQNLYGAPGTGSGGAASMDQMMSTPMQMASQMAQMPMQGAQQVGQQVSQTAGQFGHGGTGRPSSVGGQGNAAVGNTAYPGVEPSEEHKRDGAAAGQSGAERAPGAEEQDRNVEADSQATGRHRLAEPTDGIDL